MNKLTIKSIRIKNFKGLKSFEIKRITDNLSIFGDNATGKTTIIDAFYWLLFNRDSSGKSDFQIKPVSKNGSEKHNLDTEVEIMVSFNGTLITLMRRYKEKWTKKRGSAKKEHTGHTNDYFIDEVPTEQRPFKGAIQDIVDPNVFELVTNPFKFNSIHWKERRNIIIEMAGDVSNEHVIDSNEKLKGLAEIIGKSSINDHKKKISAKKKSINDELKQIPPRIDELSMSIEDDEEPDKAKMKELEGKIKDLQESLSKMQSNEMVTEKRTRIIEIHGEIQKLKNDSAGKENELKKPLYDEISKLNKHLRKIESSRDELCDSIKTEKSRNEKVKDSLNSLTETWKIIKNEKPDIIDSCPVCKQALPEENIERAKENFNMQKAEKLEKNISSGKKTKKAFDEREKFINESEKSVNELSKSIMETDKLIKQSETILENMPESEPADTKSLELEKTMIGNEVEGLLNGGKELQDELNSELAPFLEELDQLKKQQLSFDSAVKSRERIKELGIKEKNLAEDYENIEKELFLIEQFIICKVEMIEDKINSMFKMARFKMFEKQINEGISECCETTFDGVPFNHGLNNASRINVGLDIIQTLSEFYGFAGPVFVDNAESINEIIDIDTQLIALSVSDDKELVIK